MKSSTHRLSPITPDYIRVGSRFCLVSWPRLAFASVLLFLAALFFGPSSTAAPPAGSGLSGDSPLAAPVQQQETTGSVLRRAAKAVVGRLQTLAAGGSGSGAGGSKRAAAKAALGLMRPWCRVQAPALPPLGASQAWRPAALGTSPWPTASQGAALCDWAEKTTTQVSFRVCTFPREKDTQVSAYIHKEGHWSGWKKGLAEEFLPLLDSAAAWRAVEGRTLVLDIGANLGFYTLLAATRGYDVLAFEPSALCVERLLLSLDANGVQVASSAKDSTAQVAPFSLLEARQQAAWDAAAAAATAAAGAGGGGDASKRSGSGAAGLAASLVQRRAKEAEKLGRRAGLAAAAAAAQAGGGKKLSKGSAAAAVGEEVEEEEEEEEGSGRRRKAAAWVFQNAASDTYATLPFSFMEENPGASFVQWADTKKEGLVDVGAVVIDDLLSPGTREPGMPVPSKALPSLEPSRVRFIKVSAEGLDSRALHGLRRLLSVGRVPFLIFVYNDAHIKEHGCDPWELIGTLVDQGYRMWHAGIFYARQQDVQLFLKGQGSTAQPRSSELVFVGPGIEWA